jgi:hypothetical protein
MELKDIDLGGFDAQTSRITSAHYDLLMRGNNSSSLSNFVLPQNTTRTIKTNRSHYTKGANALIPISQAHQMSAQRGHNSSYNQLGGSFRETGDARVFMPQQQEREASQTLAGAGESGPSMSGINSNSQANQTK